MFNPELIIQIVRLVIYIAGLIITYVISNRKCNKYTDDKIKSAEVEKQLYVICDKCGNKIILSPNNIKMEDKE